MKCQGEEIVMKNYLVLVTYFGHDIQTKTNHMKNVMKQTKQNETTFMYTRAYFENEGRRKRNKFMIFKFCCIVLDIGLSVLMCTAF